MRAFQEVAGASSSLERFGAWAFSRSGLCEIQDREGVRKRCESYFSEFKSDRRVTSGASSSLGNKELVPEVG